MLMLVLVCVHTHSPMNMEKFFFVKWSVHSGSDGGCHCQF